MIDVKLQDSKVLIKFKGENFNEILNEVKNYHLKYIEEEKAFTGIYQQIYNIIPNLQKIEAFRVSEEIKELIKPHLEVKYKRRKFDSNLLKVPPLLGKEPNQNYQIEDIQKVICTNRKIINWDTRLGKSYLSSVVLSHLFNLGETDSVLIVCPNHLKLNWKRELKRFYYKDLEDSDFYITSVFNRQPFESNKRFIITSYKNLVMISDDYYKKQKKIKSKNYRKSCLPIQDWFTNRCLICDESHYVKNNSRQTKALLQIKDYFEFRYLLSATIMPNSIVDIYYQLQILDENILYMDYYTFLNKIAYLGTRFSQYDIKLDKNGNRMYKEEYIEELKENLSKYIIVRKKEECLNLPKNQILKNYCELSKSNLNIYQNIVSYYFNVIKESKGYVESLEVKNKVPYILQALNNINMLKEKIDSSENPALYKLIKDWKFEDHSKLEVLDDLLEKYIDDDHRKVIVFSYHPLTLENLKEYYQKKYKNRILVIHGQIEFDKKISKDIDEEKDRIIALFKNSELQYDLLLANPAVIKTGLDLIVSNRIIYFDKDHNFETYYQSKDRIYGPGQTEETIINNIIVENTFDQTIDLCLEQKRSINDLFCSKETRSKDEWQKIFMGNLDK